MANLKGGCAAHPQGSTQRPVELEWEPPPAGPGSDCSPGAFGPWKVALIGGAHLCCSQGVPWSREQMGPRLCVLSGALGAADHREKPAFLEPVCGSGHTGNLGVECEQVPGSCGGGQAPASCCVSVCALDRVLSGVLVCPCPAPADRGDVRFEQFLGHRGHLFSAGFVHPRSANSSALLHVPLCRSTRCLPAPTAFAAAPSGHPPPHGHQPGTGWHGPRPPPSALLGASPLGFTRCRASLMEDAGPQACPRNEKTLD